ncbi:VWA domain-containing protein [bacterium]|nr:VWA domain-containing protein [bacterium]
MHVAALLGLSLIYFDVEQHLTTVIDSVFDDADPNQFKFDATAVDQIGNDSSVNTLAASQAAATAVGKNPQEEIQSQIDETLDVQVPSPNDIVEPPKAEMLSQVATTGGTEYTGGVEGSIDRLAFEIANSLREKKTLVVWLFDVSPSLSVRREKIADRVENVYGQLNTLNVGSDKALRTAIGVFGEKTSMVTDDPIDETADVVKAVRSIKSEESGKENVFNAVLTATQRYLTYRTKQNRAMMIIVVTDEAGSDADKLEQAIQLTKRYGIKCFCVGDAAPLGRQKVEAEFTLDNGETVIGVMDRGPEGYFQDRLNLPYFGVNGGHLENISSGFGPYGLTRLCAETNGLFLVGETGMSAGIDPIIMRSYAPDYRPIKMLETDIQANAAKRALVGLCEKARVESIPVPTTFFPAENDNVLRVAVSEAQKPLAVLDYRLDELLQGLQVGEKDRAKITEPRWRAVYDLALGRVLAMKARSFGYNMMLAEMKSSPKKFETEGNNSWRLVPSKDIASGPATKKLAKQAEELLKRVIDEHSGTPWAKLAELEYQTPMGWEWKEGKYNPQPAGMGNGKDKQGPRFEEVVDPKTGKKIKKMIGGPPPKREI